ncbi:MAG: type VII secretion protein EccCb [Pseudonocardiaceae bacterium]
MQVVVQSTSGEAEVEVAVRRPQATVGDLVAALGASANGYHSVLTIGERTVQAHLPLAQAGLYQGAVVRLPGASGSTASLSSHGSDLALAITGGAVAGPSWPLARGSTVQVGRDPANDVVIDHSTVSGRHCTMQISASGQIIVDDLGSRNGTWLNDVAVQKSQSVPVGARLRIGAVFVSVVRPATDDCLPDATPRRGAGTVPLNRPPRSASPRQDDPLEAPAAPPRTPDRMPLSIVAIIAPLVFAGVMYAATQVALYALFALLSPVMAIGTWLESRRRTRQAAGTGNRQFGAELAEFRAALDDRVQAETDRRRKTMPHPAELLRWAGAPSTHLWERRPHHDDFLQLHGGMGTFTWLPAVTGTSGKRPVQVDEALATAGILRETPVGVDLAAGRAVGIVGDRPAALALARSLLLQATTLSGPADLRVAVITDRVDDWEWAKWLPHTAADTARADRLLACGAEAGNALLRALLAAGQGARGTEPTGPVTLVVLDAESLTEGPDAPARAVLRGEGGPTAGLIVSQARHRLPALCTTVIELAGADGNGRLNQPAQGEVVEQFLIAGVGKPVALRWARALTRFADPELAETAAGLPDAVGLVPLLETDLLDPQSVASRWRRQTDQNTLSAPIGGTADGVLRVDLVADGPHGLVVGTTGSGKSELLRTVIAGLAATLSPDHVNILLVDCRGSRSLDQCAHLPHAVGLITDLNEKVGEQVLKILEAEISRRERVLRTAGATDVKNYLSSTLHPGRGHDPLPRLLIAVDDFERAAELGKLAGSLADIAQRGSDLGIHLLLATPRLSGAVNTFIADTRIDLRLVLRTQTEADSITVIGSGAAATVAPDRPGRGFARFGSGKPVAFQAARVQGVTSMPDTAVDVHPFRFGSGRSRQQDAGQGAAANRTAEFARFVAAVDAACTAGGLTRPRRLWSGDAPAEVVLETVELPGLLGIDDVGTLEPATFWRPTDTPQLRVPIGMTPEGQPLHLDVKESARGGMGPHGLVVGATGSGKSEFLLTLVGALAVTHSPEQLSFVLVDFKGGATFSGVAGLPHVAGLITNLENDLSMIDRMHDALFGEQRRRQELLHAAGGLGSVHDYQKLRATGVELEPLPALLIIVDEFAELLTAKPDFIDLFVSIGRLGRSLGMHLLLSSQRLEEGRLRGLESHIRYRVGLRTFSAQDSRAVLGVPDAYELPSEPGVGYLKVDMTTFTRFKGALISMPYVAPDGREPKPGSRRSALDVVVGRLAGAPRVHQVWLPPLEPVTTLDQLLPELAVDPQRGLVATGWHGVGRLVVPVGVVDRPAEQRRGLVEIDAAGAGGNLVVVGAPQTGKSTLLRTVVTAFALTHTPAEVQFYCLDYGGGGLAALDGLPHVGSVASRLEPDKVRRLVAEVDGILARREELFRERAIDSAASLRALRQTGSLPDEQLADVFLVIDNWAALRRTFEDLEESVLDLASRGLGYGIHVIVTVNRWLDIRANLRDSLGGVLELRLTEPAESSIDRKVASNVPVGVPGRGLIREKLHFQAAVPRIDGKINNLDLQAGVEDLVSRVASAWSGPAAPAVRLLPAVVNADQLPAPGADHGRGVPVGVVETDLSPWYLDLAGSEPHFLVFGDGESGKTTFLRTFITGLCARHSHKAVRVGIIDYRRTLLETVAPEYLGFYAGAAPAAADAIAAVRAALIKRLPGSDVSAAQLRARSWWQGPELYVVVDDYDLVATTANPLSGLLEFVAQGRDLGFHLIIARRVAGAQRALFEPVLQQVRELGNPGIILSGDRGEGVLLGTSRATTFPPGRGLLVRRKEQPVRVQVAWTPQLAESTDSTPPSR